MRLRALACAAALVATGGVARGDAFDHIGDGAPFYGAVRPVALVGALQRMGVDQLPAVQRLRRQLGGVDPFNPAILAAPGIDIAAPLVVALFEPAGPNQLHSRVAATLRDPATFATFIDAVAASGQVKLSHVDTASPLGRAGVIATGEIGADATVIIRVRDSDAVLDLLNTNDRKKAPSPAEVARRFPLAPARAFDVAHGARRLFAPDSAAVLYVDPRRWEPFLRAYQANNQHAELKFAPPQERAAISARWRTYEKKCAPWLRAPATFDDVGLALGASPDGMSLTLAWGTQSGPPLGGLKLHPVDDADLDAEMLGRDATAVVALYAASLQPFGALKRTGPFASSEAFAKSLAGCEANGAAAVFFRSWPLFLGMFTRPDPSSPVAAVQKSLAGMRTVVAVLRDLTQAGPRGALSGTFEAGSQSSLDALLASSAGGRGVVTSIGKRSPTIYPLTLPGFPRQLAAALESLAAGRIGLTVADSDETLTWAYRTAGLPTSAPSGEKRDDKPPILRVAADLAALPKLGPLLNAGRDEQQLLEVLAHLRRVDGDLVADGDLLRLTLRSPLKQ